MPASQLTVRQYAQIMSNKPGPSWSLATLLQNYNQRFISLRSATANLSSTTALLYFCMQSIRVEEFVEQYQFRPPAVSDAEWLSIWSYQDQLPRLDLQSLGVLLESVGASIVYLSPAQTVQVMGKSVVCPAWTIVGVAGTFAALASLVTRKMPWLPSQWTADDWQTIQALPANSAVIIPTAGLNISGNPASQFPFIPFPGPTVSDMYLVTEGPTNG
jgi:hypothetical protein